MKNFVERMPKAELHPHPEGTLELELMSDGYINDNLGAICDAFALNKDRL